MRLRPGADQRIVAVGRGLHEACRSGRPTQPPGLFLCHRHDWEDDRARVCSGARRAPHDLMLALAFNAAGGAPLPGSRRLPQVGAQVVVRT